VTTMGSEQLTSLHELREQLLQELRKAAQARELLRELECLLTEENHPELGRCLRQLKQLAQSLPEGHIVRLLIESAIRPERMGSVGRARSALEGKVSTLRGVLNYHSH
jgi:transposase